MYIPEYIPTGQKEKDNHEDPSTKWYRRANGGQLFFLLKGGAEKEKGFYQKKNVLVELSILYFIIIRFSFL